MKFNIISNILFLFLMVLFFPSLIYAPWTEDNPPSRPIINNIVMNCAEWIHFNGFALDNYQLNRNMAMSRDLKSDKKASTWAAIYAFKIGGIEEIYQITPQEFCNSFGGVNRIPMRFSALEDEIQSCEGWLRIYGFSENNVSDNYAYAMNSHRSKVKYISIYAYDYWLYLRKTDGRSILKPSEHCRKVGVFESIHRFVCPYRTLLSCREWIMLYEYNNNPQRNKVKAENLALEMLDFPLRIHFFPDRYAFEILSKQALRQPIDQFTHWEFCLTYHGNGSVAETYSFYYAHEL